MTDRQEVRSRRAALLVLAAEGLRRARGGRRRERVEVARTLDELAAGELADKPWDPAAA